MASFLQPPAWAAPSSSATPAVSLDGKSAPCLAPPGCPARRRDSRPRLCSGAMSKRKALDDRHRASASSHLSSQSLGVDLGHTSTGYLGGVSVCRCWSRGPFTSSPPGSPLPASSSCSSPTRCSRRCRRRSTPEVRLKPAGGAVPRQPERYGGAKPGRQSPQGATHTHTSTTHPAAQSHRQVGMINIG